MEVWLPAALLLAACGIAAAGVFQARAVRVSTPLPATPTSVPAPSSASSSDLLERVHEIELEVRKLRREQASFIEDAETLFDAVERKRRSAASSAAKIEGKKRGEQPALDQVDENAEAIAELDRRVGLNPGRRAELRAVAQRLAAKGIR